MLSFFYLIILLNCLISNTIYTIAINLSSQEKETLEDFYNSLTTTNPSCYR
jgi:hypothetical protein